MSNTHPFRTAIKAEEILRKTNLQHLYETPEFYDILKVDSFEEPDEISEPIYETFYYYSFT